MLTLIAMRRTLGRVRGRLGDGARGRTQPVAARARFVAGTQAFRARLGGLAVPSSESGITLIEVIVSALIVGLIAVGTLTGFDSASRATGDERAHNEASLLAAQDEERLRGLNITELDQLGSSSHETEENGTNFTIASSAQYVSNPENKLTCEATGGAANYIQTTSKVTWPALHSRAAVTQSSIVDVPTSLTLLVKVWNQNHEGVEGATVKVTNRARTVTDAEETTPLGGCIVFGALPEKEVDVQATAPSYVNEAEELAAAAPAKEVTLSPTTLTGPIEFIIAPPGKIEATFKSNGSTTGITGDTFFATHSGVTKLLVGGKAGTYASSAKLEGLFPFQTSGGPNPYKVYAGECAANSPTTVAGVAEPSVQVEPNGTGHVEVEVPAFNLTVYKGTSTSEGVLTTATSATITTVATGCSSPAHEVKITSAGQLEQKYQPYAKELKVCVVGLISGTYYKSTQTGFSNTLKAGSASQSFFLKKSVEKTSTSPLSC
jgi:type II secretory pathway pseudopilin PulG